MYVAIFYSYYLSDLGLSCWILCRLLFFFLYCQKSLRKTKMIEWLQPWLLLCEWIGPVLTIVLTIWDHIYIVKARFSSINECNTNRGHFLCYLSKQLLQIIPETHTHQWTRTPPPSRRARWMKLITCGKKMLKSWSGESLAWMHKYSLFWNRQSLLNLQSRKRAKKNFVHLVGVKCIGNNMFKFDSIKEKTISCNLHNSVKKH